MYYPRGLSSKCSFQLKMAWAAESYLCSAPSSPPESWCSSFLKKNKRKQGLLHGVHGARYGMWLWQQNHQCNEIWTNQSCAVNAAVIRFVSEIYGKTCLDANVDLYPWANFWIRLRTNFVPNTRHSSVIIFAITVCRGWSVHLCVVGVLTRDGLSVMLAAAYPPGSKKNC